MGPRNPCQAHDASLPRTLTTQTLDPLASSGTRVDPRRTIEPDRSLMEMNPQDRESRVTYVEPAGTAQDLHGPTTAFDTTDPLHSRPSAIPLPDGLGKTCVEAAVSRRNHDFFAARDMLRRCLRKSQWSEIYEAEIRVWNEKLNVTKYAKMAFMLPHEILNSLLKKNPKFNSEDLTAAAESVRQHCRDVTEGYGQTMIPMALWSDGTRYSWDRTSSLEVIMMSLPGLGPPNSTWRFPVTALPKNCIAKGETFEDIWEIVACSCRCLFLGKMPTLGHDGSQLKTGRAKVAGNNSSSLRFG